MATDKAERCDFCGQVLTSRHDCKPARDWLKQSKPRKETDA